MTWNLPWGQYAKESSIDVAVRNGEKLPIPELGQLPGPAPRFADALKRFTDLVLKCTERDPALRPRMRAALNELKDLCITEKILQHAEVEYELEQ